jgi:hypothetical protein
MNEKQVEDKVTEVSRLRKDRSKKLAADSPGMDIVERLSDRFTRLRRTRERSACIEPRPAPIAVVRVTKCAAVAPTTAEDQGAVTNEKAMSRALVITARVVVAVAADVDSGKAARAVSPELVAVRVLAVVVPAMAVVVPVVAVVELAAAVAVHVVVGLERSMVVAARPLEESTSPTGSRWARRSDRARVDAFQARGGARAVHYNDGSSACWSRTGTGTCIRVCCR